MLPELAVIIKIASVCTDFDRNHQYCPLLRLHSYHHFTLIFKLYENIAAQVLSQNSVFVVGKGLIVITQFGLIYSNV